MCGEYHGPHVLVGLYEGSPPRVRGIQLDRRGTSLDVRITPACAGNTKIGKEKREFRQDHPRVCGEYYIVMDHVGNVAGSPPRVRGIQ